MAPTTQPVTRPPSEQGEPPQVVSGEGSNGGATSGGDVHDAVLKWVERVKAAEPRGTERRTGVTHVSDSQSTPARSDDQRPRVEVEPPRPVEPPLAATTQPNPVAPPVLGDVLPRGVPNNATPAPEPAAPQINAPAYARGAPTSLRDFLEQAAPPEEGSFRQQLDRRMLWVMAGDYERARAPLDLVTAEQQELATRFVEAWIAIRDWHAGDPSRAATVAARELDELRQALQRLSDLSVPTVKICAAVRSFGQYDALEPARFIAGTSTEFVLYCEVNDFVSELRDGLYTSTFDMTTTVLNRAGDSVLDIKDANIVDRCRNRRRDCFIPRLVRLPATLPPGQYVAKVTLVDKLGQKVAENRATFQLVTSQ
jgi:hypothetical protein